MDMLRIVLPVIVMLVIGMICREKKLISTEGINGLQALVMNFTLPVALFTNFYTNKIDLNTIVFPLLFFAVIAGGIFFAKALTRRAGQKDVYLPFMLTGYEAGMLGYALLGLLIGTAHLTTFAMMDVGHVTAIFTIYVAMMKNAGGGKQSVGEAVKGMLTTPVLIGILLGLILGVSGLGLALDGSSFGPVIAELGRFISAPTSAVILVVIGYRMKFRNINISLVGKAVGLRILQQVITAALIFGLFYLLGGIFVSYYALISATVFVLLPPPFIIPLYIKEEAQKEFYSSAISVYTMLTIVLFLILTAVVVL